MRDFTVVQVFKVTNYVMSTTNMKHLNYFIFFKSNVFLESIQNHCYALEGLYIEYLLFGLH